MKTRQPIFVVVAVCTTAVSLCCCLGCGNKGGVVRYDYRGTVTFKGQPVKAGRILFEPDAGRGNRGPQGFAIIQNGAYDTSRNGGKGAIGGPHTVRINGFDGKGVSDDAPFGSPIFKPNEQSADLPSQDSTMDFVVSPR